MVSNSSFWRPTIPFFMFSDLSYKNLVVVLSVVAGHLGFHTNVAFFGNQRVYLEVANLKFN